MNETMWRFIIGGVAVSLFALVGELFKPKSFAGLFSAAPSIALGTLALAVSSHGAAYAAIEGKSMIAGAAGLFVYSQMVACLSIRRRLNAAAVSLGGLVIWLAAAFSIWALFLR
jgi:hypothetical protein